MVSKGRNKRGGQLFPIKKMVGKGRTIVQMKGHKEKGAKVETHRTQFVKKFVKEYTAQFIMSHKRNPTKSELQDAVQAVLRVF